MQGKIKVGTNYGVPYNMQCFIYMVDSNYRKSFFFLVNITVRVILISIFKVLVKKN
jgi:hypothetical protein